MNRKERAVGLFTEGFSCSQAVAAVFAEEHGLQVETALRLSQGFGGGMARMAETCGAVTGAILVIGLKHGRTRANDDAAKEKTYALVQEFVRRFRARHGSLDCRDLLGCDIGTPEGMAEAKAKDLFAVRCNQYIADAVEIAEEMM